MTLAVLPIRAADLQLIAILDGGKPAFCSGEMPPAARDVLEATAQLYADSGFVPPWIGYLAQVGGEIVGTCAFKTAPQDGKVEIAYYCFEEHERRGIATAMASKLLALAWQHDAALIVCAYTLPQENVSTRILRKLGFRLLDSVHHPQDGIVWYWEMALDGKATT